MGLLFDAAPPHLPAANAAWRGGMDPWAVLRLARSRFRLALGEDSPDLKSVRETRP